MELETKLMIDMKMGLGSDDAVGLPFVGCGKTQSCFQGTHGRRSAANDRISPYCGVLHCIISLLGIPFVAATAYQYLLYIL